METLSVLAASFDWRVLTTGAMGSLMASIAGFSRSGGVVAMFGYGW